MKETIAVNFNLKNAVHGNRVSKEKYRGKDWFVKKHGSQEITISVFYSLFVPHSPQVRVTNEGYAAYKGIPGAHFPKICHIK